MKACETCDRVVIGREYAKISPVRAFVGLFFVYSPIIFLPFILLAALMVYVHLKILGAKELKSLRDFLTDRSSHRYEYKSQIVYDNAPKIAVWTRSRVYWLFNCTWYCPISVGSLEWFTYLVKVVENWWCPFAHQRKPDYSDAAIDFSYWHNAVDVVKLHDEDRDNPIWNEFGASAPIAGAAHDQKAAAAPVPGSDSEPSAA